ncbi:MAG TPA: RiPP maturation radical SAM C-methyltransferase [Pyrinomonadaceae bacterium]|nr:RiPP maturation radical SAM C-methyltransferase [Pyrinomonadaceae bacterium]
MHSAAFPERRSRSGSSEPDHLALSAALNENNFRVGLVNMPFASSRRPSIQLGLLQAILAGYDIPAASIYFNLDFGSLIGWEKYESLCHERDFLLGEWLFARAAFAEDAIDPEPFLEHHISEINAVCTDLGCDIDHLVSLRESLLPAFIDDCVKQVEWSQFNVVGFSSIFEQNCAALALARRLKARFPKIVTVFGGANFEDEMGLEYIRALPWINYAVIGEGDQVFPELVRRLVTGEDPGTILGVASRLPDGTIAFAGRAAQIENLDLLPEPAYADYFETAAKRQLPDFVNGQVVSLPIETARGCWWGAKHHCTFCGLNGLGMKFRSKSPARVLSGIDELARQYDTYAFLSVDNILDQSYIGSVFEPLAQQRKDYTFFFEVKANLTPAQLRTLKRGGVRIIQPGIESLDTHALQLMRKGTTRLQNVRLLKWANYYHLVVTWNLLLGFPGECLEDCQKQVATMRLIPHLCPPGYVGRIRLDRFSPNFFDSHRRGFQDVRPIQAYGDIYPHILNHDAIAYFFSYCAPEALLDWAYVELKETVREWQKAWEKEPPFLVFQRGAGRLTFTDGRYRTPARVISFGELEAQVYEACTSRISSANFLLRHLRDKHGSDVSLATVEQVLARFSDLGLVLEEDGEFLGLALPVNQNW